MTWQFWIDRGGTFTDVVARAPDGAFHVQKLLSEDPDRYQDAAVEAMRRITGTRTGPLPEAELRLGTTVATNALLERKGEPVLLAITAGLRDVLKIGTQARPDIFAREIILPAPLYADVIEIPERLAADGAVVTALDEERARAALRTAYDHGLRAVAIALMHSYRFPQHEHVVAELAREVGFTQVSASHEVAPLIKIVPRGETSVVDAYLSPVLGNYMRGLEAGMGDQVRALYMQSSGGLATGDSFRGKDAILSGPAGGIVGMAATAREAGFAHVVGFDMGGTSTDVSHYHGEFERDNDNEVADVKIRTPMMRIHTVAAGGGSICDWRSGRFQVGPQSAGAVPGPACYGRGGPLTVTDCNLILGKLQPAHFPHVFGAGGDRPLDAAAAAQAMQHVIARVEAEAGRSYTPEEAAEGFLTIAVTNMANAIKRISLQRGHDVTRAALVAFGGAGGQHACRVADALGIDTVLCHPLASLLSAYGMGLADRSAVRETTIGLPLEEGNLAVIEEQVDRLAALAKADLCVGDADGEVLHRTAKLFIRPAGTQSSLDVAFGPLDDMRSAFHDAWKARFGFAADADLRAESIRVEQIVGGPGGAAMRADLPDISGDPETVAAVFSGGQMQSLSLYRRNALAAGFGVKGPALIVDQITTIVVEPGWRCDVDGIGNLVLKRSAKLRSSKGGAQELRRPEPVKLEIMGALFMAIAEEMGAALQASASSVNIRERLDFSCALFDRAGNLIANAPHMPVHLGSMGESVRTILTRRGGATDGRGLLPGDAYALNTPYDGGTHLPDITVVMPVFAQDDDAEPAWFVAARGHHADIGGIAPGSMPPLSRTIEEEGVLIDNFLLVDEGQLRADELRALLAQGRWPARNPAQNVGDIKAQVASCVRGAAELHRIAAEQGRGVVDAYMGHVQDQAEAAVRALFSGLKDGAFTCSLDNGAEIALSVQIDPDRREAVFDFTGTSAQLPNNFNAPKSVVRAAVLYAVRTLIDDAIPMNEGCLRPIRIIVTEGSMLDPRPPAAVVAGNVETSQLITDAIFGALGAMAASQGTMNNFTFGTAQHQYYETIAGGAGAGPNFAGASAVQTHMTNSRLTDPEVLETSFPVRLNAFGMRRGSGGRGTYDGGDGVVRHLQFLEPMSASILSGRRDVAPFGLAGGKDGACGLNVVHRADGTTEQLGPTATVEMGAGDVFEIRTPGGGGFGGTT